MSERESESGDFLKHLQDEKLKTQAARNTYVIRKLVYATGLLGLGSIKPGAADLSPLLYVVPFLALAFDLYILGEDYSVKRIGAYLGAASCDPLERRWEQWVADNRDPFAPFAMPLLTNILVAAAAVVLWSQPHAPLTKILIWLPLALLPSWGLFLYYRNRRKKVAKALAGDPLIDPVSELRIAVEKDDYVLTPKSYRAAKGLFLATQHFSPRGKSWKDLSPEYGNREYLCSVDSKGSVVSSPSELVEDFRRTREKYPDFEFWFREGPLFPAQEASLFPARWLCHLAGFRHLSAHLFLMPGEDTEYVLVQVRGIKKPESPGCFDLAVAGHVGAGQTEKEAAMREAKEELDLDTGDLRDLTMIGGYEYLENSASGSWIRNVEFRRVFKASLSQGALAHLRPAQDEVAAISLFSVTAIESLVTTFPERVASGLRASLPVYTEDREAARRQGSGVGQ